MKSSLATLADRPPLKAAAVMARLGFKDKASFWAFVWKFGVPCIRLNSRNIIFDELRLQDWLDRRSTGHTR